MSLLDEFQNQKRVREFIHGKSGYSRKVATRRGNATTPEDEARVKHLLEHSCCTQTEIARRVGLSISVVSRIKNGKLHDRDD